MGGYDDGMPPRFRSLPWLLAVTAALTASVVTSPRAADPVLTSTRVTAPVSPDGMMLEWPTLQRIADGLHVAAANDETSVFVGLIASTPQMRVSLSRGVVFWLDASGGHQETFGLQLPGPSGLAPVPGDADTASGLRLTPTVSDRVDVLGPGKFARRLVSLDPTSARGLGVGVGGEDGALGFEARIPLQPSASDPIAIGTRAGGAFTLGIATPVKRKGPREPLEPMNLWYDPYRDLRYPYLRQLPPTAPLTNAADRPPPEVKPKEIQIWLSVRLSAAH